ncbi:5864_t:CDS:2, partial [Gigaspora rosea]
SILANQTEVHILLYSSLFVGGHYYSSITVPSKLRKIVELISRHEFVDAQDFQPTTAYTGLIFCVEVAKKKHYKFNYWSKDTLLIASCCLLGSALLLNRFEINAKLIFDHSGDNNSNSIVAALKQTIPLDWKVEQ